MSEQTGSQTAESQEQENQVTSAFEVFGLEVEDETPETLEQERTEEEEAPAIEQKSEPKVIKVKHNKEEIEVDVSDEKLPEYVQKALALEKERERKTEYEKSLDRVAKLQGFNNHADLVANLDRLEQEAQRREIEAHDTLRADLRQQAEDAGLDPDAVQSYLDNHPLMKEAQKAIQERERVAQEITAQTRHQQTRAKWDELYSAYPELVESSQVFNDGGVPDWFTPEMQNRIARGYDPMDAYELAHKSKIIERNKHMAKQQAIKEQRLGLRSQVETNANADLEPDVPDNLASAFSLFGLSKESAKKYVKAR